MNRLSIRILSVIMAVTLLISCVPYFAYAAPVYAKLSDDGKIYSRLSNGEYVDFYVDFDDVIAAFKQNFLDRKRGKNHPDIEKEVETETKGMDDDAKAAALEKAKENDSFIVKYATSDPSFAYIRDNDVIISQCSRLLNKALEGAFEYDPNDPFAGDFLYHSINAAEGFTPHIVAYPDNIDNYTVDGKKYYSYEIGFDSIDYFSNKYQEKYFEMFVDEFNKQYINPDYTPYEKVKTIYDFVIRNTTYDHDVRNKKIEKTDPRYKDAHSAYGAACGNLVDNLEYYFSNRVKDGVLNEKNFAQHFKEYYSSVYSVEEQKVLREYNAGLAVCEGYSNMFYALCVSNGIICHIVDGDYADGVLDSNGNQKKDPHEWNCVMLQDSNDEQPKWYLVDTTYGAQHSLKEIEYNNYDFFLIGSDDEIMSKENHQIPYTYETDEYGDTIVFHYDRPNEKEHQLYDWYGREYGSSKNHYDYPLYRFSKLANMGGSNVIHHVLVSRKYTYNGEERSAYVLVDKDENGQYFSVRIEIDEEENIIYNNSSDEIGFPYRSIPNMKYKYHLFIPYVVDNVDDNEAFNVNFEADSSKSKKYVDVGNYKYEVKGDNGVSFEINIPIRPLNMSNDEEHPDNYINAHITTPPAYIGKEIELNAEVIDGYGYHLKEGKDYDIVAYEDAEHLYKVDKIEEVDDYYIGIEFKGNYTGVYKLEFDLQKADLSTFEDHEYQFEYLPHSIRANASVENLLDYYKLGTTSMKLGDRVIVEGKDYGVFYVSSNKNDPNGLEYGTSGYLVLTGLASSPYLKADSKKLYPYTINKQYDLSSDLKGKYANSKPYVYTGSAIEPTSLDNVEKYFGKDEYSIDKYKNNVNAGTATVTVNGIGGCKGSADMVFVIQKKAITSDMVTLVQDGKNLYLQIKYNGMILKPNVDYNLQKTANSIIITGASNSNYSGTYQINGNGVGSFNVIYGTKPAATTTTPVPKSISLSYTSCTYNGKVQRPSVTVKDARGKVISPSYYKVIYSSGCKNVGTYKVTVGNLSKTYVINPKGTTLSKLTAQSKGFKVTWKKQTSQTTGYQIRYSTKSNMSGAKTVTVKKNGTTSSTVKKLSAKKKYYVQIRTYRSASGKTYYSSWSAKKTVTTKK